MKTSLTVLIAIGSATRVQNVQPLSYVKSQAECDTLSNTMERYTFN